MKFSYRHKIFFYFFIVFALFTIGIIVFEQEREKKYKADILAADQDVYTAVIHEYIQYNGLWPDSVQQVESLLPYLPENVRVTVIKKDGKVLFDNDVAHPETMENHIDRPEIKKALLRDIGSNIRQSASMHKEYLYFARNYEHYYVRVALPYDITLKNFLKADYMFLYFIIALFFATLLVLLYISNRFGQSISTLKDFADSAETDDEELEKITFPDDELGEIGKRIAHLYKQINKNRKKINVEREKLLQHFQHSQEGVCFFSPEKEKIYANSHFIQYFNLITDIPTLNVKLVFEDPSFSELQAFLLDKDPDKRQVYQGSISKNGKHFDIKTVRFDDGSFEITINDMTKLEKTRLLKQTMTSNIAHDLRTPVTSIRGYLETLKEQPKLSEEKRRFFIERAFSQILRLSDLIRDISLITRMEEASDLFEKEQVKILPILNELQEDLFDKLQRQQAQLQFNVDEKVVVKGNRTLLYSVFRNLMDNSLSYAGEGITISISNYMEDDNFYYFSYYDTGVGVEERHLIRIFERFYRINEGRTSDTGGSGLGLAIVKNAVLFHKGEIVAKTRKEGGLEFLFTLHK